MTFLKTRYTVRKELTRKDFEQLTGLSTVYGILALSFEGRDLLVEYDASRLHEAEVLALVRSAGIAVDPLQPIAAGAFDQTGQFHDM